MKRVAISTLGCKTNQFESAAMIEQLKNAGYIIVPFTEESDIYIINSCTVTARTDVETRRIIRRTRRMNPESRIIATGCYAQIAPGELEKMPEVDAVFGNQEKQNISELIESNKNLISDIGKTNSADPIKLTTFSEHTRAFLQIQNGCNSFCSYCIVPFARGRSRSVSSDDVLQGVLDLTENGFKEIVLTGIHLGAYGFDLKLGLTLAELIEKIDAIETLLRLRIGSVEPNEFSDELLSLMSDSKKICHHIHLPLQSGSDAVLQRMGRRYDSTFFRKLILKISLELEDVFIGADVIAGFPGETENEFAETVSLLEELPLSDLHVFPYSRRPGTKAASMPGHLSSNIITERAATLRDIAKRKKRIFLEKFISKELDVLVQSYNESSKISKGISRNYITVKFKSEKSEINKELKVLITGVDEKSCLTGIAV